MGILGGNKYFSADYATSRHRFRREAERVGAHLEALAFDAEGPDGLALTLDVAWLGPRDAKRVVVVSSATHGVEGFMGAAVQQALLENLPENPDGVALVFQHAINPYGFAHVRRVNEDNADLNRNFLRQGEAYTGAPEGYADLDALLNPAKPPHRYSKALFLAKAVGTIAGTGLENLKGVVAGGQYTHPRGLFFGGLVPSQSNRLLSEAVPRWFGDVEHLLQVDLHTGLGRPATYKLLVDHPPDAPRLAWLKEAFGDSVQPWDDGEGVAYAIRGGLGTWMKAQLPEAEVDVLAAEFGTVSVLNVISALHLENRAHHWGDPGTPYTIAAKARMMDTFAPADRGWRDSVVDRGHRIVVQALAAI